MSLADDFETLPRNFALVVVFNTMIAFGLTAANPTDVFENFVRSQCIGVCILLAIDPAARLIWRGRPIARKPFLLLCALGTAAGFFAGTWLANAMLGGAERSLPWATREQRGMLAVTLFASVAASWYFWNRSRITRLQLKAATLERQGSEAQLRLLQAQIEPHFLFNTLANVHSLIAIDGVRAQRMLEELNEYLRASLLAARKPETTLADEFVLLRRYLELMGMRMGHRLSYALDLPQPLQTRPLPPMLLQPLVENAIKHGVEPKVEGGRVEVSAQADRGRLRLHVRDTGLGLGGGAGAQAGTGVGVEHVRARLLASYGSAATLTLENQPAGGALATIELPLPA